MNILFLPSWYESEEEPNSGSFFTEQALALKNENNNVVIALVDIINYPYKCSAKKFKIIEEHRHGIEVYRIKVPSLMTGKVPGVFFKYYKFFYIKLYKHLLAKGHNFDIIYAHSFWHAGYIGTFLKKKYGIPLIVQEHRSMLMSGEFSNKVNKYLEETVKNSDAFYSVSRNLKDNIYKRISINTGIEILPNMVGDIFKYSYLKNEHFVFTFIGSLDNRKRILQLLRCFDRFCQSRENVVMNIVGDGPLKNDIESYIHNNVILQKCTRMLGVLSREAIAELLKKTNVFALTSAYETFGVVYIEAMAIGRPVIATKNGGADDLVNDSNGILIDVDNDEQLLAAMDEMYEHYSNYHLEKISNDCRKIYSKEVVMNKVLLKMRELVNAKG